jgi:hypothetical protein
MPTADDQVIAALERRFTIVSEAPFERFRGELASYLEFVASHAALRAAVDAALAQEAERLQLQQAQNEAAAHECALRMSAVAQKLTVALRPWLRDGTLPSWIEPLLLSYDLQFARTTVDRGESLSAVLWKPLQEADLCAGEIARLLREADDAMARQVMQRAALKRATEEGLSGALARLWSHIRYAAPQALLPEWGGMLETAAGQARAQSSQALLRQVLEAPPGTGLERLHADLLHDLRLLNNTLVDALMTSPPTLPALERFRHWCEIYERDILLRKVRPGKKATEAVRRRKRAVIVAETLRFLYSQGFTPLTLEMLENNVPLLKGSRYVLIEIRVASDRASLLDGYVNCVQALRGSERARQLGITEAFMVAFMVDPAARYIEPSPLSLGGLMLRSVFIDLTAPSSHSRLPLDVAMIATRIAEEDRLFEFLNTASEAELDSVPGIGPAKIQQIFNGRPFTSAADLRRAGLPTSGALYQALRERALRGTQTLLP